MKQNTAAGPMNVVGYGFAPSRGNTNVFFGTLENGKWAVASRFQYEIITTDEDAARAKYHELVPRQDAETLVPSATTSIGQMLDDRAEASRRYLADLDRRLAELGDDESAKTDLLLEEILGPYTGE